MLDVYNTQAQAGQGARTQLIVWVGGPSQAVWPNLPTRLRLVADRAEYKRGHAIFIPTPSGGCATLLTMSAAW
jgi:hypothetical protein